MRCASRRDKRAGPERCAVQYPGLTPARYPQAKSAHVRRTPVNQGSSARSPCQRIFSISRIASPAFIPAASRRGSSRTAAATY